MYQLTWKSRSGWREMAGDLAPPAPPSERAVRGAAVLMWEEHCVECAVPSCYRVCPLYMARGDGQCARFAYGIYPNRSVEGALVFGADIRFRRWGKLEAFWPARPRILSLTALRPLSAMLNGLEKGAAWVRRLPLPGDRPARLGERLRRSRKRTIRRRFGLAAEGARVPDALYIQVYSAHDAPHRLQLEIDREAAEPKQSRTLYRKRLDLRPGWNSWEIPFSELPPGPGKIRLWPENDAEIRLVFTWLDLVVYAEAERTKSESPVPSGRPAAKVKCVAWDLDGTLWDGVIGEDGAAGVTPRAAVLDLVKRLDERGILQTVASKNDFDVAWPRIEALGLGDMFLYPAIHWGPKSESLRRVATELNIGLDSFAFVDDSPFERAEVSAAWPQVRVFDSNRIDGLLERDEFDVPVTEVSRKRRLGYLTEARRKKIAASWEGGHDAFLRSCRMVMRIGAPREDQKARCLELLQRSNQFNLSARRYDLASFEALLAEPAHECLAFEVSDAFGDYGLVGFAAVRLDGNDSTLFEFVMSCRVARKRIEEAFLCWYGRRAQARGAPRLQLKMRPTGRNGPLRDSLAALPLRRVAEASSGDGILLTLGLGEEIPTPDVVRIEDVDTPAAGRPEPSLAAAPVRAAG